MSTTGIPRNETVLPLENSSVMAEALMPTVIYNSTDGRDQSLTEAGGLIAMVLITILGAVGNTCLVVIILVSKNLRKNLTHAYVLNLACIDGLASILLLPLAAVTFSRGSWQLGNRREERFIFVNVTTQTDRTTAIATVSGTDRSGGAYTNTDHVHSQVVRTSKSPPHTCKAFRTLLLVYGSFLCLWVPYYVISLISPFQSIDTYYVLIATWLGYASFAINPFFYGWLNRSIREQIVEALQHCKRKILCRDPESAVRTSGNIEEAANGGGLESGGAFEDFYQFIGCKASYDARNRPGDMTNIEQRF
ncbi:uncharacterized protein LOC106159800 [Lingula anatina]|uniref:Uncharacterized protein LOC106159800 n=1 Tax=Lingula anatina TaxID=7574 RepID=A0A1S3I067_LINAN|nr:uncharacterized protein LOC106159800 [Lingula anatina]|eukprot:XP_013391655.1 uncharacterized protein LOC106159800 [Lingula anatina]